jgi:hypothetical protein
LGTFVWDIIKTTRPSWQLTLLVVLAGAPYGQGAIISHEPFDLGPGGYTVGFVNGQGPSVAGYAGNWFAGGTLGDGQILMESLQYADAGGQELPASGGSLNVDATASSATNGSGVARRLLNVSDFGPAHSSDGTAIDQGTIYLSFLFRGRPRGTAFLQLFDSIHGGDFRILRDNAASNEFALQWGLDAASIAAPGDDLTHLFVAKFELGPGNDIVTAWFDPALGQSDEPSYTPGTNGASLSTANISFNGLEAITTCISPFALSTLEIDEIRFGTTWASVTPVPEPGGVVLALFAALGACPWRLRALRIPR